MRLYDELEEILSPEYLEGVSNGTVSLRGGQGENRYKVELTGFDMDDVSVVKLGTNPHSSLIRKGSGFNRVCDYLVLLSSEKNRFLALFLELKKTFHGEGARQLQGSLPILAYLQSMLQTHFDHNRQFSSRFIVISDKRSPRFDKQTVRPSPILKLSIDSGKFEITNILGKSIPFEKLMT